MPVECAPGPGVQTRCRGLEGGGSRARVSESGGTVSRRCVRCAGSMERVAAATNAATKTGEQQLGRRRGSLAVSGMRGGGDGGEEAR